MTTSGKRARAGGAPHRAAISTPRERRRAGRLRGGELVRQFSPHGSGGPPRVAASRPVCCVRGAKRPRGHRPARVRGGLRGESCQMTLGNAHLFIDKWPCLIGRRPLSGGEQSTLRARRPLPVEIGPSLLDRGHFLVSSALFPIGGGPFVVGSGPLTMASGPFLVGRRQSSVGERSRVADKGSLPMERCHFLFGRGPLPMVKAPLLVGRGPRPEEKGPFPVDKGRLPMNKGPFVPTGAPLAGQNGGFDESCPRRTLVCGAFGEYVGRAYKYGFRIQDPTARRRVDRTAARDIYERLADVRRRRIVLSLQRAAP